MYLVDTQWGDIMKKTLKLIAIILLTGLVLVMLAGMYKFNYLASKEGYDIDGNKIEMKRVD
jgi:flagellar basal body-associated protein FliL